MQYLRNWLRTQTHHWRQISIITRRPNQRSYYEAEAEPHCKQSEADRADNWLIIICLQGTRHNMHTRRMVHVPGCIYFRYVCCLDIMFFIIVMAALGVSAVCHVRLYPVDIFFLSSFLMCQQQSPSKNDRVWQCEIGYIYNQRRIFNEASLLEGYEVT